MNGIETPSNGDLSPALRARALSRSKHRSAKYTRAYDDRKRPIRGLWLRSGRFYAQMTVADRQSGRKSVQRVPLSAETAAEARKEMDKLRVMREANTLPVLRRTPKFSEYSDEYIAYLKDVKDAKRASTIQKEKCALGRWKDHLNELRLNQVTRAHINSYRQKRQIKGASGRTVNLDVIAFRNVLKKALDEGLINSLPTLGLKPLKCTTEKRATFSLVQINAVCEKAVELSKNGRQFSDYVRLMAFCGSRRDETLRLQWSDVSFDRKQLTIGADGLAKNYQARVVDFNADLENHLQDMHRRRAPDSEHLFPSPQRGEKNARAKTFRETLAISRSAAGLPRFNFHDCRHFFISQCVMSGIDFMTIAEWVGHQDGGVLIGKVYGSLADERRVKQASRASFDHQK